MADGKDNFKEVPAPTPGGDSSARLIGDAQQPMPVKADVTKVGDTNVTPAPAGADKVAYATDVPPGLTDSHYPGGASNPQANLDASTANIAAIYDKVTTPDGQAALNVAAAQMIEHFNTPGLKEVMPTTAT
jgi:hypothetical protein